MDDRSLVHDHETDLNESGADLATPAVATAGTEASQPQAVVPPVTPPPGCEVTLPFAPAEVRNVMAFCVRRLVRLDSSDIQTLNGALCVYEGSGRRGSEAIAAAGTVIDKYNKLNDLLEPLRVNGASVHDSTVFSWRGQPLVWAGMLLLVSGLAAEILAQSAPDLTDGSIRAALTSIAGYAGPMAWGALGATVFLIKTLSDKVSDFAYEEKRLSGTAARVFLGAVFGLLIVKGFAPKLDGLPQIAIAFLAGLGTKAVYAAIEAVVNGMAERLSGQPNGSGPTGTVTEGAAVVPTTTAGKT